MFRSKLFILLNLACISALLIISTYYFTHQLHDNNHNTVSTSDPINEQTSTDQYIANFNPQHYEMIGADYFNPRYNLDRIDKPIDQIDTTYDYPFGYLAQVATRLEKVDRRRALKAIFSEVTAHAHNNLERHLAVLKFLQQSSFHNFIQPMYPDKQAVFDPLLLLELGEMRCGAVARVAVDLFEAAGYKARLIQAAAHVSAEVHYDGTWHFFEADLSGGQPVIINGKIPSIQELAQTPFIVDKVPSRFELLVGPIPYYMNVEQGIYRSYYLFSKEALQTIKEAYYYKTASISEALNSKWYGWNYYTSDSNRWPTTSFKPKYEPSAPEFESVNIIDNKAIIKWREAIDNDHDILGYKVFISSYSRGWNYESKLLPFDLKKYVTSKWKPYMYENLYKEPPSDIGIHIITKRSIEISIEDKQTRYVTVMPFDRHGESVGRILYNMSPELTITRR
jgi:hypothetical protein